MIIVLKNLSKLVKRKRTENEDTTTRDVKKKPTRTFVSYSSLGVENLEVITGAFCTGSILSGQFGVVPEMNDRVSHLVIEEKKRTLKVLEAISRGIWVLKFDWILASIEKGAWVDEKHFEASDWFPGCELTRTTTKKLLESKKIYIQGSTDNIPREALETLVLNAGGSLSPTKNCDYCFTDRYLVSNLPKGVNCLSSLWLLDSIEQGKLLPQTDYIQEEIDSDEENFATEGRSNKQKKKTSSPANKQPNSKSPVIKSKPKSKNPEKLAESSPLDTDTNVAMTDAETSPSSSILPSDSTIPSPENTNTNTSSDPINEMVDVVPGEEKPETTPATKSKYKPTPAKSIQTKSSTTKKKTSKPKDSTKTPNAAPVVKKTSNPKSATPKPATKKTTLPKPKVKTEE